MLRHHLTFAASRVKLDSGCDARKTGRSVVGGLAVSQVLTLYLTPVIYLYLDRVQARFSAKPAA